MARPCFNTSILSQLVHALDALGTAVDDSSNRRCSSDGVGSVSIPHGLGCYNGRTSGAVVYYQCDKWYTLSGDSRRMCMGDGKCDGEVPQCSE